LAQTFPVSKSRSLTYGARKYGPLERTAGRGPGVDLIRLQLWNLFVDLLGRVIENGDIAMGQLAEELGGERKLG